MTTCSRCERERVVAITMDDSIEVSGHTFTAHLPAMRCEACGQVVIQGKDMRLFELRIAVELARAGTRSAAAFKFMREAAGFVPEALAHLLDVPEDFIGYWEKGDWPVDPRAQAILCSLILGRYDDRAEALDCLAVLRAPRKLARKVRVDVVEDIERAGNSAQSGSAAAAAPALA